MAEFKTRGFQTLFAKTGLGGVTLTRLLERMESARRSGRVDSRIAERAIHARVHAARNVMQVDITAAPGFVLERGVPSFTCLYVRVGQAWQYQDFAWVGNRPHWRPAGDEPKPDTTTKGTES